MDLNAEVDNLVKVSQAWIPMIMEYGSRVLLAVITLAIGWWLINNLTRKVSKLLAMRNADQALQATSKRAMGSPLSMVSPGIS